jgi:hypothetical protein
MADVKATEKDLYSPTLIDALSNFIVPGVFFLFVVLGFVASCVAGLVATSGNIFKDFKRVHLYISGETLFNITARELNGLLAATPYEKILVVIGGTSRFQGVGQRPDHLWGAELQRLLGPGYEVVNLALRAGRPDQFGNHAAEGLIVAGRKVIYVADIPYNDRFQPAGTYPPYFYIFYDARARGLLLASAERDAGLAEFEKGSPDVTSELKIRAAANAALNFDDLWTFVGYEHVFLPGWTQMTNDAPFRPRRLWSDNEPGGWFYDRYDLQLVMKNFRAFARPLSDADMDALRVSVLNLPEELRKRSLIATIRLSPYYTDRLLAGELASYKQNYERAAAAMTAGGLRVVELGADWAKDDFFDPVHPSESGGVKSALQIAPLVKEMAQALGYEK